MLLHIFPSGRKKTFLSFVKLWRSVFVWEAKSLYRKHFLARSCRQFFFWLFGFVWNRTWSPVLNPTWSWPNSAFSICYFEDFLLLNCYQFHRRRSRTGFRSEGRKWQMDKWNVSKLTSILSVSIFIERSFRWKRVEETMIGNIRNCEP